MSIKSYFSKIFARQIYLKTQKWASHPEATQKKVFQELILEAKHTAFGEDHHFDQINSYEDFRQKATEKFNFAIYEGFADSKTCAIWNFDFTEADKVYDYLAIDSVEQSTDNSTDNSSLNGLTIAITGKLTYFKNRAQLQAAIEQLGGKIAGSVSAKTSYLVNNDINSTSGKNKKAKELGVPIINEEELIKMLN